MKNPPQDRSELVKSRNYGKVVPSHLTTTLNRNSIPAQKTPQPARRQKTLYNFLDKDLGSKEELKDTIKEKK